MAIPEPTQVREYLEGYGVTATILSDAWMVARRDRFIIPALKRSIGYDFVAGETKTEYVSGNGKNVLILSNRPVVAITAISYVNAIESGLSVINAHVLDPEKGMLIARSTTADSVLGPAIFRKGEKNIRVTYTVGGLNEELEELVLLFMAKQALLQIANRTGGGDISTQAFSRTFGALGKYTNIIKAINRDAAIILSHYTTGVVAS